MTARKLSIVALCSYNRVRSVMIELLLQRALDQRGVPARVGGWGFATPGVQPLPNTVRALHRLGVEAGEVLSRRVEPDVVERADLVLAAERMHVVRVAEDRLDVFAKAFTLPEFVERAVAAGPRGRQPMAAWLARVGEGRTHEEFLRSAPEIADPAGLTSAAFDETARRIDEWCTTVAGLL